MCQIGDKLDSDCRRSISGRMINLCVRNVMVGLGVGRVVIHTLYENIILVAIVFSDFRDPLIVNQANCSDCIIIIAGKLLWQAYY